MRTVTPRRRLQRRAPSTLTDRARRRLEEKTAKAQLEAYRTLRASHQWAMTLPDAARVSGYSYEVIRQAVACGQLPTFKTFDKRGRGTADHILASDLEHWLNQLRNGEIDTFAMFDY